MCMSLMSMELGTCPVCIICFNTSFNEVGISDLLPHTVSDQQLDKCQDSGLAQLGAGVRVSHEDSVKPSLGRPTTPFCPRLSQIQPLSLR